MKQPAQPANGPLVLGPYVIQVQVLVLMTKIGYLSTVFFLFFRLSTMSDTFMFCLFLKADFNILFWGFAFCFLSSTQTESRILYISSFLVLFSCLNAEPWLKYNCIHNNDSLVWAQNILELYFERGRRRVKPQQPQEKTMVAPCGTVVLEI